MGTCERHRRNEGGEEHGQNNNGSLSKIRKIIENIAKERGVKDDVYAIICI
jgi:hypothetical protein